jgi:hypothetical protein
MHWDIRTSAGSSKSLECTECKISIGLRFSSFLSLIVFIQSTLDLQDRIDHLKIVVNNDQQGLHPNLKPTILSSYYLYGKNHTKIAVNNWTKHPQYYPNFHMEIVIALPTLLNTIQKFHMKILVKNDNQDFINNHNINCTKSLHQQP